MFYNPVRIGWGSVSFTELPALLESRRAALLTTPGMVERGTVARLREAAAPAGISVFTGVVPNPTIASITAAAPQVLDSKPELLIALGGGSALDTAKGIAAIGSAGSSSPGWLSDHLRSGAPFPDDFSPLPIVAIPTTAGTGSEVTMWGTVWDERDGSKKSISHQRLFPEAALLVPELTLTLPAELTLFTGLDAISHCMESIWNRRATSISDAFAVAGLKKLLPALGHVLARPHELIARRAMQEGALLGGLAISCNATALAHSMSYPLTSRYGMPHGLACSFTLPELIRFNGEEAPQRVQLIAEAMRARNVGDAANRLEALFRECGVPEHVRRYLDGDRATEVRESLLAPGRADNNLRAATSEDALGIIHRSLT